MLAALGRVIARRPGVVLAIWLLITAGGFAAALGGIGEGLFARLTAGEPTVSGEATDGRAILTAQSSTGPSLSLLVEQVDPADPALAAAVAEARPQLAAIPGVLAVADPFAAPGSPEGAALLAADGAGALISVTLAPDLAADAESAALDTVQARLGELGGVIAAAVPGSAALVGGGPLLFDAITVQVQEDLITGEAIALPVSLLVMVFVFGGFLAAGMPIVGAIASIGGALASLLAFSYVVDLDATVVNVVTVLGLGLCIDYGLLVVSRYREELRRRMAERTSRATAAARADALVATMGTAGRTVVFSGVTVAISLSGMLVFEATILRAVGAAGVSVVVVALLVALTLVPAFLALAGRRMIEPGLIGRLPGLRRVFRRFGDVAPDEGVFSRLARGTQRRPWLVVAGVVAVLGLLAAPALRLELRSSGVELLPPDAPQRQFFDTLAAEYPGLAIPAVQVVGETGPEEMTAVAERAAALPGVALVAPPRAVGDDHAVVSIFMTDPDPGTAEARAVVEVLRSERPAYPTWVTGQTAELVDFTAGLTARAPLAIGVVVFATFVLLFLMTGSILVPLKALLMNVVSLGASFGVLVWVFQDGNLEGLLGFASAGGIETVIPVLVLAFGFGLAMDYEVFLLSRIKEFRDGGMTNDEAVVAGLQRSGRIITSAGLVVVLVFSGFVFGQLLVIKQTGVALAVAVAIDATLVRCLLVPATMTLLGEWNWWAPAPLRRFHERFGVRH